MDEVKFLTALNILYQKNKLEEGGEFERGYAKALYDVLQTSKLCKKDKPLHQ